MPSQSIKSLQKPTKAYKSLQRQSLTPTGQGAVMPKIFTDAFNLASSTSLIESSVDFLMLLEEELVLQGFPLWETPYGARKNPYVFKVWFHKQMDKEQSCQR
jgi:hypothetical protein